MSAILSSQTRAARSPASACDVAFGAQEAQHRPTRGGHQRVVLGHDQFLQHRHAGKEADVLEGAGDAGARGDLVIGHALQQEDGTRAGLAETPAGGR
jgi:hypothetical protein